MDNIIIKLNYSPPYFLKMVEGYQNQKYPEINNLGRGQAIEENPKMELSQQRGIMSNYEDRREITKIEENNPHKAKEPPSLIKRAQPLIKNTFSTQQLHSSKSPKEIDSYSSSSTLASY